MSESKTVAVEFDIKALSLTNISTRVFGVEVTLNKEETKLVGKCTAEELKAFKDAGKV